MNTFQSIDKALSKVLKGAVYLSVFSAMYMTVSATVDVIMTKFFNLPIPGTTEMIEDLNIVLVFMALGYVQISRGHMTGGIINEHLSKGVNKVINLICYVMAFIIAGLICWRSIPLLFTFIENNTEKIGLFNYPLWPFALVTFIGFALLTIAYVLSFIRELTGQNIEDTATESRIPELEENR
jgi:TRAP-type C4-dicarboxylate transport system permease small subunit